MSNTQAERVEALMELVDAHGAERWSTGYEEAKSPSGSPASAAYDAKAVSVREELRAEIAGLIADAERYRWLRDQCQDPASNLTIAKSDGYRLLGWSGDDPDAAIDYAMKEQGGQS